MSSTAPHTPADTLVPVHEAAAILGGSPKLYAALIEGGIIEGTLVGGVWHVNTGTVGAALAVRSRARLETPLTRATCTDGVQGHPDPAVDGAA